MASNGTAANSDDYVCDLKNQCVTIISISTFFGLLLICSSVALCYRCFWPEDTTAAVVTTPLETAQQQQEKPETIEVAVDEDPS